jgi:predicted CxxxxCH...CXXCH cytochrome family protein
VGVAGADANVKAAPPGTATGAPAGAHLAHVNKNTLTTPVTCATCHAVPSDLGHSNGVIEVVLGGRATQGGAAASYAAGSCSSTYCHGSFSGTYDYIDFNGDPASYAYAGTRGAPGWTGGAMTCNTCHDLVATRAVWHSGNHGNVASANACETCHPDATGLITPAAGGSPKLVTATINNPAQHVNGALDLAIRRTQSNCRCHYP